jgi:hypothetical protein
MKFKAYIPIKDTCYIHYERSSFGKMDSIRRDNCENRRHQTAEGKKPRIRQILL